MNPDSFMTEKLDNSGDQLCNCSREDGKVMYENMRARKLARGSFARSFSIKQ